MEKRIFKFGESGLAIILPKKWADKSGIGASGIVHVSEDQNASLVISTREIDSSTAESVISQKMDPVVMGRLVGLHYMYGTGKLRLYSKEGFPRTQLVGLQKKIQNDCPGFEITSQSQKDVMIEDYTNLKEIDIHKIVQRLKLLITQEFEEMSAGNLVSIPDLESLVNRFYMMGIRYLHTTQPKGFLKLISVLELLERISDSANIIAASKVNDTLIFKALEKQFKLCFAGFDGDDRAIETVAELRVEISKRVNQKKILKVYAYLIEEMANNITAISEFGLMAAQKDGLVGI